MKALLTSIILILITKIAFGQHPQCTGNKARYVYAITDNTGGGAGDIYQYDPSQPIGANNPTKISVNDGSSSAIAISNNLNGGSYSPTFYSFNPDSATMQYWDGSKWMGTGHYIGSPYAVNMAAGGGYIYNFDAINGKVYRYRGTGDAILLTSIAGFKGDGPYDMVADCNGNFYILKLTQPRWFRQYNNLGILQNQWTLVGGPTGNLGGGMALVNDTLYFDWDTHLYKAHFVGTNMYFTIVAAQSPLPGGDYASCPEVPIGTHPIRPSSNPAYHCENGTPTTIRAVGSTGPVNWSVLSGPATIFGSGDSIAVSATADAKLLFEYYDTTLCGRRGQDTVDIIIPKANLDAGLSKTVEGCGTYLDSLEATLTGLTTGVTYNATWTPSNMVTIPGTNKLKPIINPTKDTFFVITVTSLQGNCSWKDSVYITIEDLREDSADFTYDINYGCDSDIVNFTNITTTTQGPMSYLWTFGDNSPNDTMRNTVHTYRNQGIYDVTLIVNNGHCNDTITKTLPLEHPIDAAFVVNNTTFCTNLPVEFDSRSTVITQNPAPKYFWEFGDGQTSTDANPSHYYRIPGKYNVRLTVTDFVPCVDTASMVLDNFIQPPFIDVGPRDTIMCAGELLNLPLGISARGTSYQWNTGETTPGIKVSEEGTYIVELINDCAAASDTITVTMKDCSRWLPTAFSPNGDGINDIFSFNTRYPEDITSFTMSIYNRKGNRVFTTTDLNIGWDGSYNGAQQPIGTYYYMISYKYEGQDEFVKGDITLVR